MSHHLRNIAIIAHVDHGKTTLVDKLLQQSGTLERREEGERLLDSNEQEKERGITILAKNTAIQWGRHRINIVDTPGHADFGGEVERVLSMVESVLLLVDAVEGPMPQTRFVTAKAFARGLNPIVAINKIDRPGARPDWVVNQVFELFDHLGASEAQLDFPVIYTSGQNGVAGDAADALAPDLSPLFDLIIRQTPPPQARADAPLQMQISALDYNSYVGVIGIGRVYAGEAREGQAVQILRADGGARRGKIGQILRHHGLSRRPVAAAQAGDIACITGIDDLHISDTITAAEGAPALPPLRVDEPTISMTFQVNDSPFAGREGKFLTSRHIRARLQRELLHNVALRVEEMGEKFKVSGRGELHLSVLIETLRREGYELGISRPEVVGKTVGDEQHEPYETALFDVEEAHQGDILQELARRGAVLKDMQPDGGGRVQLEFVAPSKGLIGFRGFFLTLTSGTGLMNCGFSHYAAPSPKANALRRKNGVLISMLTGKTAAYALHSLQNRGQLLLGGGTEVYEGQIVGIHSRDNDLTVNPVKGKQLTNFRASGTDEALILTPPIRFTLEQALAFIEDDELVEVTPAAIRLRKKFLVEHERKRKG